MNNLITELEKRIKQAEEWNNDMDNSAYVRGINSGVKVTLMEFLDFAKKVEKEIDNCKGTSKKKNKK